jgi:hypothetical protein
MPVILVYFYFGLLVNFVFTHHWYVKYPLSLVPLGAVGYVPTRNSLVASLLLFT